MFEQKYILDLELNYNDAEMVSQTKQDAEMVSQLNQDAEMVS